MTRDEARAIMDGAIKEFPGSAKDAWVAIFERFGLLKLDEPQSAAGRAENAIALVCGWPADRASMAVAAIYNAGLKIIEQ